MKVIKRPCLRPSTGARPQQFKSRAFHPITSHNEDLYTDLHPALRHRLIRSGSTDAGESSPILLQLSPQNSRVVSHVKSLLHQPYRNPAPLTLFLFSYFTKRDIEPIEPVTPAISVRSPDTDLHTRSVPLHIQWCLPGSTIYLNPVYVGQQALGIAASVVEAMVLEALEHVDQYLHTHGEG